MQFYIQALRFTASGISDYATKSGDLSISKGKRKRKGYIFQHLLSDQMFFKGMFKKWIQQNHDRLQRGRNATRA